MNSFISKWYLDVISNIQYTQLVIIKFLQEQNFSEGIGDSVMVKSGKFAF